MGVPEGEVAGTLRFFKILFEDSFEGTMLVFQVDTGQKGLPSWRRASGPQSAQHGGARASSGTRGREAAGAGRPHPQGSLHHSKESGLDSGGNTEALGVRGEGTGIWSWVRRLRWLLHSPGEATKEVT